MLEAVEKLLEASIKCECNVAVRIRALVLYHHFMRCSSQKSVLGHNDIMVAAASLKCASRYEEKNLDYDSIVLVFYSIMNDTEECPDEPEFLAIKKSLITVDLIMQRKLEYVFSHRLAHQFIMPFLSFILERNHHLVPFHQSISEATMKFANDLYTDPLCINYKPDHLAISCIHAALHVHGLLRNLQLLEPWFQAFSRDLTISKLREIKIFLLRLYKNEKQAVAGMDVDSEVIPDSDGEKDNTILEKADEEVVLIQEVEKKKQDEPPKRHNNKGKRKRGKEIQVGKNSRKHHGGGKRRHEKNSSKLDRRGKKNSEAVDKNKNEEVNKNKNVEVDRIANEGDKSENKADEYRGDMAVSKKKREGNDERAKPESSDPLNKEMGNITSEGSRKEAADRNERTEDEEGVETAVGKGEKEQTSVKDVSTIDAELSVWASRLKAACSLNCPVEDV